MCTLSVVKTPDKIIITMNRDEHRLRHESNKIRILKTPELETSSAFPEDKKSGGTWFGINDSGVVLALLNRYQNPLIEIPVSRGEIIPKALAQGSINSVYDYCGTMKVKQYNPFDLILVSKSLCFRFKWDGENYTIIPIEINSSFFITSSSIDMELVLQWRKNYFERWFSQQAIETLSELEILKEIHLQQDAEHKSRSIFMSREHSHSKSISQITLSPSVLDYSYYPEESLLNGTGADTTIQKIVWPYAINAK